MRVNINIDEDLLKRIDKKAKSLSMSRSAYISLSCSLNLRSDDMFQSLPELLSLLGQTSTQLQQLNSLGLNQKL